MEKIEIKIPENVTAQLDRLDLSVEGPNGKVSKRFQYPGLLLHSTENSIIIERSSETKKTIAMTGTFRSHILNLHQSRSGINLIAPETSAHGQRGTVEDSTFFSIMSAVKWAHFSAEIKNGRNLRLVLIAVSINPGLITVTAILCCVR